MTKKRNFFQALFLLRLLVQRNIKNQYYRSVIGILWTVLNPLLNMLVMAFVFSVLFGSETDGLDYLVYFLAGNIIFNVMRSSTASALPCLVQQRDMLLKTKVHAEIFPISNVLSSLVTFFFSLIALLLVMILRAMSGFYSFHWQIILFPLLLPALSLFSAGIAFFLSALYVFFRDIKHIYSVILTLWTYLTPLFYSLKKLQSETAARFIRLNPMYHFVTLFRTMLVGTVPPLSSFALCYLFSAISIALGCLFFSLLRPRIAARL